MSDATEDFERHHHAPERTLVELLPVLQQFRAHLRACRTAGLAMHPMSRDILARAMARLSIGGKPVTDESAAAAATKVLTAAAALLEEWDQRIVEVSGIRTAMPGPGFDPALEVLDAPEVAVWGTDQPAGASFLETYRRLSIQAQQNYAAAACAKLRAALVPGTEVTLSTLGGLPVAQTLVVSGNPDDGVLCADGRQLDFKATGSGRWLIRDAEDPLAKACEAHPARPLDPLMIAAVKGTLDDDMQVLPETPLQPAPKSKFVACANLWPADTRMTSCADPIDPVVMIDEILPKADFGPLLAYMTRRFGPPFIADADTYKSMTGAWCLSTPLPDLRLMVQPSTTGPASSFSFLMPTETIRRLSQLHKTHADEHYGRVAGDAGGRAYLAALAPYTRAMRTVLLDLLRPVRVRDCPINAQGRVSGNDPLCRWNAKTETPVHEVAYAATSTFALPLQMLENPDTLRRLLTAIAALDPKDHGAAMTRATRALEDLAPDPARIPESDTQPAP